VFVAGVSALLPVKGVSDHNGKTECSFSTSPTLFISLSPTPSLTATPPSLSSTAVAPVISSAPSIHPTGASRPGIFYNLAVKQKAVLPTHIQTQVMGWRIRRPLFVQRHMVSVTDIESPLTGLWDDDADVYDYIAESSEQEFKLIAKTKC